MKKKYVLGFIVLVLGILIFTVPTKAESVIMYSVEGNITYRRDTWRDVNVSREEWEILYNITIPIELKGKDRLYWHQKYSGECDSLQISYQYGGVLDYLMFTWLIPGYSDSCDNTVIRTVPNDSFGGSNTYLIARRSIALNTHYIYSLTWEFWIERDIVEKTNESIGIDITPFLLVFMSIGVIVVLTLRKRLRK